MDEPVAEIVPNILNVTSGNIVRIHVKSDGNPFPSTGFDVGGGINRPVATLTTAVHLKTDLSPGSHSVTVEFDTVLAAKIPNGSCDYRLRSGCSLLLVVDARGRELVSLMGVEPA
jgi:hypothetical protein